MVLSSWHTHCETSHSSYDECKTAPVCGQSSDLANQSGPWIRLQATIVYTHMHWVRRQTCYSLRRRLRRRCGRYPVDATTTPPLRRSLSRELLFYLQPQSHSIPFVCPSWLLLVRPRPSQWCRQSAIGHNSQTVGTAVSCSRYVWPTDGQPMGKRWKPEAYAERERIFIRRRPPTYHGRCWIPGGATSRRIALQKKCAQYHFALRYTRQDGR